MRIADAEVRVRSRGHKATQSHLRQIGKQLLGFIGIAYAVRAAFNFFKEGIEAALDYSESLTKIETILTTTGGMAGVTKDQIVALANEMQYTTGISKNMILQAEGIMLTFTQISGDVFPDAVKAAADMSQMFGQDLQQSVIQLGTALNSPIAGVGKLKRIGISFTDTQKDMIKSFMDQNDIMGAQKVILDELHTEFGGISEAVGDTLPGKMKILSASLDDIKRGFGAGILSSGLFLNAVTAMTDGVVASGQTMEENIALFVKEGLDNIVLFVNSSIAMLIKTVGGSIGLVEMFVVGMMEMIAKSFSWVLDMAIKVTAKMNEILPGYLKVSIKSIEELKKAVDGFATEATHDVGMMGEKLVKFAYAYEEAAIDIKTSSSLLGVDLSGGLTPAQQKLQDIVDEFNNMGEATTGAAQDVEVLSTALEKLEKRVGTKLSATVTTVGSLLAEMNETVTEGIMEQTEAVVTESVSSVSQTVGLVMKDPEGAGLPFAWKELGGGLAHDIFGGLQATFSDNAPEWGKIIAKILFRIVCKILDYMFPGVGTVVGQIGGMIGLSVPSPGTGQTIIIQNVNAMDAGSFVEYVNSYPVQREMYGVS